MDDQLCLRINREIDVAALRREFEQTGQVRISRFLEAGSTQLYKYFEDSGDWVQLVNHASGAHEIARSDWEASGSAARARLEPEMFERACDDFQYSYAALRIPPADEDCDDPVLRAIAAFMRSPETKAFLAGITGIPDPRFVDGQATCYSPGDFLTGHDDALENSGRQAAFVMGLTPQWRLEWGGLLMFHELGQVGFQGMVPQFNTLDLFRVPKYHSVSMVTRAAPRRRYCVTGWLAVD